MAVRRRAPGFLLALGLGVAAAGSAAPLADQVEQPRDVVPDVGKVRGPLSDFWFKVRSEWSGYLQPEPLPPPGGGILRQRTLTTPPPNRVWVSLVYGDPSAPTGGDASGGDMDAHRREHLSHLFKEFLSAWKRAEGRNWPYAQIYDRTWEKMGPLGRVQNIIMIGTPWTLPPVGPLAEKLGFHVGPGRIDVGTRKYRGDNLILIFIAPNPENPQEYALVITGSGDEALLQAGHLPYGDTDYVIFEGRRLVESGVFSKPGAAEWGGPGSYEAKGVHHGFSIRESAHYTFWYEPDRISRDDLDALVSRKEDGYPALAALLPAGSGPPPRVTYHLYASVDRKIDETARDEVVHVDLASAEIHAVYSRAEQVVEPYLDLMVMMHRAVGPTRVPRLERALAIAMAPSFEGREVLPIAAQVFHERGESESLLSKTLRGQDVLSAADGPPAATDLLVAGFLQDLARRYGRERAVDFLEQASPGDIDGAFKKVFKKDLGDALETFADRLRSAAAPAPRPPTAGAATAAADGDPSAAAATARAMDLLRQRRDTEAAALLEQALHAEPGRPEALMALARIKFRGGRFDAAEALATSAVASCARDLARSSKDCPEVEAWSHLTLGRVEAMRGRYVAAHVELTHPAVVQGPAPVPTLADYWLLTMGQSRNQLTVVSHLKREARVSLRQLDWLSAEQGLKRALEIDPTDGEAHRLLSEVYHRQHEYWAWQLRYLNETHPDYNVLSRIYMPGELNPVVVRVETLHTLDSFNDLVLKGNLELLKAQSLYAVEVQNLHAEGDRFLIERQDVEEALRIYRRALDLNSDFFLSHFLVGRCYFLMGRYAEAKASFEEVQRRKPSDPLVLAWTHTYMGYIALQEDDLPAAQRSFERALSAVDQGKAADLAREGLGKVETIRLLMPKGTAHR